MLSSEEMQNLREQWEEDCRKMVPDFVLLDSERMILEIERFRKWYELDHLSDVEVVIFVLRNLLEDQGDVPEPWWWITANLLLLDDMESHPWFEVTWWVYQEMRGKRETSTLWGSASCGKTAGFSGMVLTNMVVWHGDFHCYVTSPYKNAGADKIWKEITRRIDLWIEVPPQWALDMGFTFRSVNNEASLTDRDRFESTLAFVSLETTAPVQGKKRTRFAGQKTFNPRTGLILIIGDELIINSTACLKFQEGEGNLISNTNFMGWVGMNPLPIQVRHPNAIELSAPVEQSIETLNEHINFTWRTLRGRLLRFCMDNSPNRFHDEPVFDFLINKAQAEAATKRGENNYQAQVAAWGWADGMGNGGVLSLEKINTDLRQTPPVWLSEPRPLAFFDLAFGGRDPAGFCALEEGQALIDGKAVQVISGVQQSKLHVMRDWTPTKGEIEEFERLARERGGKVPKIEVGEQKDANHHMTYQVLKKAAELRIPKGRVSFDSSLRPDVTIMMINALGSVPWFYSGTRPLKEEQTNWPMWPPVSKPDGTGPNLWSDKHSEPISAAWRFAEHLVAQGHVFGLTHLRKGLLEIISRMWVSGAQGKTDVESKKKLKVSPMWGETLALGLVFAVRFCGALPQLLRDRPYVVGGDTFSHPAFKIKSRRVDRHMWA